MLTVANWKNKHILLLELIKDYFAINVFMESGAVALISGHVHSFIV
jgi:hypothetical protein